MTAADYVVTVPAYSGRRGENVHFDAGQFPRVARIGRLGQHCLTAYSGTALSKSTTRAAVTTIRDLLGYLSKLPAPPQDLRYLDETALDGWVDDMRGRLGRASTRARATTVRFLLDNLEVSELHETLTDGRHLRWRPFVERECAPLPDLSPGQWAAVRKFAKRSVLTSAHRIRATRSLAACGSDPGHDLEGWRVQENIYWLVLHGRFDVDLFCAAHRRDRPLWLAAFTPRTLWDPKAAAYIKARLQELLLPAFMDMAGFWTAMAIATGLPPESINEPEASWFDTAPGGELTLLRYRKQRRGTPTSPLVLPARPQFSAQSLCNLYQQLSAPLRPLATAGDQDRLWLYANFGKGHGLRVAVPDDGTRHFPKWVRQVGLLEAHDAHQQAASSLTEHHRCGDGWDCAGDVRHARCVIAQAAKTGTSVDLHGPQPSSGLCFDLGGGPQGACRNVILDPPVHLAFWDIEAARLEDAAHAETRPLMRQRLNLELDSARGCITEMEAACRQHPGRLMRRFSAERLRLLERLTDERHAPGTAALYRPVLVAQEERITWLTNLQTTEESLSLAEPEEHHSRRSATSTPPSTGSPMAGPASPASSP